MSNNVFMLCFFVMCAAQAAEKGQLIEFNPYLNMSCGQLCSERHRIEVASDERLEKWLDEKPLRRDVHDIGLMCSTCAPAVCACCLTYLAHASGHCDANITVSHCIENFALNVAKGLFCGLFSGSLWACWYQPDQTDHWQSLQELQKALQDKTEKRD